MGIEFHGPTKTINLTTGTTNLSVRDLWSRWIDWFITDDNSKYQIAMTQTGGEDIDQSAGTSIPIYIFLQNGWRIKPQEANHTLNVSDGILLVDGGGDPFLSTISPFNVKINYQQPVQAIGFATGGSGGSGGATPDQIWQHVIEAGLSAEQILRILVAVAAGNAQNLEGTNPQFKNVANNKTRVAATYDNGERTITTLDGT